MAKLKVADGPRAPMARFADASGRPLSLREFSGRVVVLNLWANWCAPCKTEIPSLAALARAEAAAPVAIVPVSLGKGADEAAGRAFIAAHPPLVFYSDPAYSLPYALAPPVAEIPTTILFDRQGRERARLAGGADWSGPEARRVIAALMAQQ
jgi:thiol-disulfide isomerase/thioredoxin